jgi:hypothetical protein
MGKYAHPLKRDIAIWKMSYASMERAAGKTSEDL